MFVCTKTQSLEKQHMALWMPVPETTTSLSYGPVFTNALIGSQFLHSNCSGANRGSLHFRVHLQASAQITWDIAPIERLVALRQTGQIPAFGKADIPSFHLP